VNTPRALLNLALTGFMGTGKSSAGRQLAGELGFRFVDTDELVEARAGKRVSDIFAQDGEPAFRLQESAVIAGLAGCHAMVISTGGGAILNPANLAGLKTHAFVVSLWASPETIWQRTRHQSHRPLLCDPDPLEKIRRLLAEREPFYKQADLLLNTDLRSTREVVQQILHQFRQARETTASV